jgi:hypothetical protein
VPEIFTTSGSAQSRANRWTDDYLDPLRHVCDPPADDAVRVVFESGVGAVNELMRALVTNDGVPADNLPKAVQDFLHATGQLPSWTDRELIQRSERFFGRWGMPLVVATFHAALPSSYVAAKGVQVLYLTARLATNPRRRIVETAQFLMENMAPDALAPGGTGIRNCQKVRLMHAAVRRLIHQSGLWNPEWGEPINQEDLGGTLLTFTTQSYEGLERVGITLDPADLEANLHAWNVIGHLMGVVPEMMTQDVADARTLMTSIKRRQYGPSEAGKAMAQALVEMLAEAMPGKAFDGYSIGLMRRMLGDEACDMVGLPPADWSARFIDPMTHFFGAVSRTTGTNPVSDWLQSSFMRTFVNAILSVERGGQRTPFSVPESLARQWGLKPAPSSAAPSA